MEFIDQIKESKYYKAAEEGFWRIWKNKFIWFWGLFVGSGASFSLGNGSDSENQREPLSQMELVQAKEFVFNNWHWFLLGAIILLIFIGIFWVISGIARSGVVKELSAKQDKKNYKLGFKKIWQVGKKDFNKILVLDLVVFMAFISISLFLLLLLFPVFISENVFLMISFSLFFGVSALFVFLLIIILKQFALIYLILSNTSIKNSFLLSWNLLKSNFKEFFKLILTFLAINILSGLVLFLCLIPFGLLAGVSYYYLHSSFNSNLIFMILFLLSVVLLIFVALCLSAFLNLWKKDILIWWVKELKGQKTKEEKDQKELKVPNKKELAGAEA